MGIRKPVIHGRDHLPGGADPIPAGAAARRNYYLLAYGPNTSTVASGTPLVLDWAVTTSDDGTAVSLDWGRLSGGGPSVPILKNGGDSFVYKWTVTVQWASFSGFRSMTVDITDNTGATQNEFGFPKTIQGSDASADQWQTLSGLVIPLTTYPAYFVVTLSQTSGVSQTFGLDFGTQIPAVLIEASEHGSP